MAQGDGTRDAARAGQGRRSVAVRQGARARGTLSQLLLLLLARPYLTPAPCALQGWQFDFPSAGAQPSSSTDAAPAPADAGNNEKWCAFCCGASNRLQRGMGGHGHRSAFSTPGLRMPSQPAPMQAAVGLALTPPATHLPSRMHAMRMHACMHAFLLFAARSQATNKKLL